MKTKNIVTCAIACLLLFSQNLSSQTDILYFMQNVPIRNELNPGFVPTQKVYITLFSSDYVGLMTNSFAPSDFVKSINGEMRTAFNKNGDSQSFLNSLKSENYINAESKLNIFSLGFKLKKNYFSVGVSERIISSANVPYNLLWLLLEGLPKTNETKNLDLTSLAMDASTYLEPALGYTREVLPNLAVGAKVKFLMGQMHGDISFSRLNLNGNYSSSTLTGAGALQFYTPFEIPAGDDGSPNMDSVKFSSKFFTKPCGSGVAFDLGAVYKPLENLTLSISLTDLGSLSWNKNNWTGTVKTQTDFQNVSFKVNDDYDNASGGDSLKNAFSFSQKDTKTTSKLTSHTRIGVEYAILDNKIGFGVLYDYRKSTYYSEGIFTGSVNFRPFYALNASIAYSQLNAKSGSIGAGLNFNILGMSIYALSDYIPVSFADSYVPKTNHINVQAGMIFTFGRIKKENKKVQDQKIKEKQTDNENSEQKQQEKTDENPAEQSTN
ncbi:exported hypothetical protein [uncultured Paludibacter sp.]|nr:exported hypothetical protein [uncultured Paludibacter sp.]